VYWSAGKGLFEHFESLYPVDIEAFHDDAFGLADLISAGLRDSQLAMGSVHLAVMSPQSPQKNPLSLSDPAKGALARRSS